MSEFWERFAFYGIRWALVLYIVAQFHGGSATGQADANLTYGSYLALVYAGAIFGGYIADKYIGYQRSILTGAVFMAAGLFMISMPTRACSSGPGDDHRRKRNVQADHLDDGRQAVRGGDERRDSGFTIFYMGINCRRLPGADLDRLAGESIFGTEACRPTRYVFIAAGMGMLISLVWFYIGRAQLQGIGEPPEGAQGGQRVVLVALGAVLVIPIVYFLLAVGAQMLQYVLTVMFIGLAVMLMIEGIRDGKVARDKTIAMMIIFLFNILFWMFFEQAGSSFTFLADQIVNRDLGGFIFPTAWFQSVNSVAIIVLAPIIAWIWVWAARKKVNPSIPRKFGLGLLFNGFAFLLLMYALSSLLSADNKIPFWTLVMVYVIQSVGELCLSPIGLSMVTKLAPVRLVGLGMGGWFLSTGIGNNLSGIFASAVSGETGMTTASALKGYTFGFWTLLGAGVVLFLLAPQVNKLLHGVK